MRIDVGKAKRIRERRRAEVPPAPEPERPLVQMPMRCDRCGLEVDGANYGYALSAPGAILELSRNLISCPRPGCGGVARQTVQGHFEFDAEGRLTILRAVQPAGVTLGDYERALELIQAGRARGASPTEIAEDVATQVPVFHDVRGLARKGAKVALAVLGALGAAASIYAAVYQKAGYDADQAERASPEPPTPISVTVQAPPAPDEQIAREVDRYLREHAGSDKGGHAGARPGQPGPGSPSK